MTMMRMRMRMRREGEMERLIGRQEANPSLYIDRSQQGAFPLHTAKEGSAWLVAQQVQAPGSRQL